MARSINKSRVRKRARERTGSFGLSTVALPDGVEVYKPKKGKNIFDVVPYEVTLKGHPDAKVGELWYDRSFYIHKGVGPEDAWIVCPLKTWGDDCPICEEIKRLKADENADQDYISSLWPKHREVYNIIDCSKDSNDDIMILEQSVKNFGEILEEELNRLADEGDEECDLFSNLEGGRTLEVWFADAQGDNFTYIKANRFDFKPRDPYADDVLQDVVDLDVAIKSKTMSYEDIEKLFKGKARTSEVEASTEAPPTNRRRRRSAATKEEAPPPVVAIEAPLEPIPDGNKECVACEGTGEASSGGDCPICEGKGYVPETPPAATGRRRRGSATTTPPAEEPPATPPPTAGRRRRSAAAPKDEPPPAASTGADDFGNGADEDW